MIVIWEPLYPGDARNKVPPGMFDDPRVVSFWDPGAISGTWFGQRSIGGLRGVVWDAYYAFSGPARWRDRPDHLLAAGSEIIGSTDRLERSFLPLLGRAA